MKYDIQSKGHSKSFDTITKEFPARLASFNPVENAFSIQEYFGAGLGETTCISALRQAGILDSPEDFKGIYVFVADKMPIYTGISNGVIKKIIQQTKGHNHFTAPFAFDLARDNYQRENPDHERTPLKFFDIKHLRPAKEFLLQQKVAFMKMEDDLELYLFEIYCAMELQTLMYNSFGAH